MEIISGKRNLRKYINRLVHERKKLNEYLIGKAMPAAVENGYNIIVRDSESNLNKLVISHKKTGGNKILLLRSRNGFIENLDALLDFLNEEDRRKKEVADSLESEIIYLRNPENYGEALKGYTSKFSFG